MKRVINFSGGRTSAMMTILNYNPETDIVLFCDTGREHPKTYKFIQDFQAWENIPVTTISYDGGWRELLRKKKALPNRFMRFCTIEMKIKTARRYLRSIGWFEYENLVGFRGDEQRRIKTRKQHWKKVKDIFPLQDINKKMVIDFWKAKPYDLELPSILGNCTLCFQKGVNVILAILKEYPELANDWIEDEEIIGHTYFKDVSIKELLHAAQNPNAKQYDLFDLEPAYNCACTT